MIAFSPENEERFKKTVAKYEVKNSALLPVLYIAQEQFGYLSTEVMDYVASRLELPPVHVYEVVSFYGMFRKKDMGEYCLQVCCNITCTMMGSEALAKVIRDDLALGPNDVSSDRKFSYVPVQCLGSCDTAPVVQVNDDYYENQSVESFRKLLSQMKEGKLARPEEKV